MSDFDSGRGALSTISPRLFHSPRYLPALCHQSTTPHPPPPSISRSRSISPSLHLGPHQSAVSPRTTLATLNFSTLPLAPNYPFYRPSRHPPTPRRSLHQSCTQLTLCQSGPLSPLRPPTQDINLYQLSTLSKLDKRQATLFALRLCPHVFRLHSLSRAALSAAFRLTP